jgi:hypothetical protein
MRKTRTSRAPCFPQPVSTKLYLTPFMLDLQEEDEEWEEDEEEDEEAEEEENTTWQDTEEEDEEWEEDVSAQVGQPTLWRV